MRKVKHTIMFCLIFMIGTATYAEEIPNNEIWYEAHNKLQEYGYESSPGLYTLAFNATIASHVFSSGKGIITFNADVTSIGESAFSLCSGLTSITIPNSVKSIGDYAFYQCSGLTSITIPNFVTSIGKSAFKNCSGLTSITIPNSVTSIGNEAFYGCSGLTSITIPNSVKSIGDYAFYGCSGLTSIIVESGNTKYDSRNSCNAIIKTATNTLIKGCKNTTIPNSVESIGSSAFSDCSGLTSITIPNSVKSIGDYAFYGCSGLTSITIPNSVTSIGNWAFVDCSGLTSITIPNSVTSIRLSTFWGCSGLTSITVESGNTIYDSRDNSNAIIETATNTLILGCKNTIIPNSVKSIGDYAFYQCSGLTSITIPNSVTSIGQYAFSDCRLNSLTIGSGVLTIKDQGSYSPNKTIWLTNTPPSGYTNLEGSVNYVSNDLYTSLKNKKVYEQLSSLFVVDGIKYAIVSPSDRTCDAIDCMYDESVANVHIGETVTYKNISLKVINANEYVCYDNPYIKNVEFNFEGNVGGAAFSGCSELTNLTLGNKISNVGNFAFNGCESLQNVVIPDGVTTLGESAFLNCTSLKSIQLGSGITAISPSTFSGCSALPSITIPKNVNTIGDNAFKGCSALQDVTIADRTGTLSLGYSEHNSHNYPLFDDCPLENVYIGGKISYNTSSSYGYSPFYRNTSLRSVVITDIEDVIYDNEFYGCTNLKSVTIGNGVKSIGKFAFSGCSGLESFSFGSSVETIGQEAFSDCTGMTKISTSAAVPPVCGSQALDDINKWECVLYVPKESIDDYSAVDQWKEFFFINDYEGDIDPHEANFVAVDNGGNNVNKSVASGDNVTIDDTYQSLSITEDIDNVNVTYSRTYKNTSWQAWYVPFGFTLTSDIASRFSFAKFAGTYTEAGQFFITLVEMQENEIVKANTPYFVCAKTADSNNPQVLNISNTTLYATDASGFKMLSAEKEIAIYGTYAKKVAAADDDWYAYGGGKYIKATTGQSLGAFRFYLTIRDREDNPYASTPNPIEIKVIVLGDEADGISGLNDDDNDNENVTMFNLAGQPVGAGYKGVVIRNGKKTFIH